MLYLGTVFDGTITANGKSNNESKCSYISILNYIVELICVVEMVASTSTIHRRNSKFQKPRGDR